MRDGMRCEGIECVLHAVNRVLLAVLIAAMCTVAVICACRAIYESAGKGELSGSSMPSRPEWVAVPSDFVYREESYDVHPGKPYVVYTNYACPYCARLYFGAQAKGISYTSRFLLMEDDGGSFATQDLVSAYMLKLYRVDTASFDALEADLFGSQTLWTGLDEDELAVWLDERSGQSWTRADLTMELEEVVRIEREAPKDLPFVPGVFQDGARCDDVMYDLLDEGSDALTSRREG